MSRETARKWLTGLALPELSRIIELAKDFDINLEWLAIGREPMPLGARETGAIYRRLTDNESRLLDAFHTLSESKRQLLVKFLSKKEVGNDYSGLIASAKLSLAA